MAATLKEIAMHTQLSQQAVSQVLNGRGRIAPGTRDRVLRAAAELGYRPNGSAKAMRSGQFGGIALLLSSEKGRSHFLNGLMEGIQSSLDQHDLHLAVAALADEKLTDPTYTPKILREWMADGLLVHYTNHVPAAMVDLIGRFKIPSIWLNTKADADCVYFDDLRGAQTATEHLLSLGHRDIAYVDYHNNSSDAELHHSVADRRNGYLQAMNAARLPVRLIGEDRPIAAGERAPLIREWLSKSDRPTAVVTYSPWTALPLLYSAAQLGLVVPRDLSVVTFAEGIFQDAGVAVTSMLLPEFELGRVGVELLLEKIKDPATPLKPRRRTLTLSRGETTAPPPSK